MGKIILASLVFLIVAIFSIGAIGLPDTDFPNPMTGSFTQADSAEEVYVEEVRWEFDNGKVVEGRLAKQNFSEGVHNVTVYIEKSNGEKNIHRAQIEVKR